MGGCEGECKRDSMLVGRGGGVLPCSGPVSKGLYFRLTGVGCSVSETAKRMHAV